MSWAPTGGGLGGSGSFGARTRSSSTDATFVLSDGVIRCDASAGLRINTLPTAASAFSGGIGAIFTLKKTDASANVARLKTAGTELIDGFNTVDLTTQYEAVAVQSNGTTWDVLFRG